MAIFHAGFRLKEGKQAAAMTRLFCHRFRANQVRLWLSLIAYNLGNLWPRLALPTQPADAACNLVADQLAAAVGEERRTAHPTGALLLVAVGRGASDPAAVCRHAAGDHGAAFAGGIRQA